MHRPISEPDPETPVVSRGVAFALFFFERPVIMRDIGARSGDGSALCSCDGPKCCLALSIPSLLKWANHSQGARSSEGPMVQGGGQPRGLSKRHLAAPPNRLRSQMFALHSVARRWRLVVAQRHSAPCSLLHVAGRLWTTTCTKRAINLHASTKFNRRTSAWYYTHAPPMAPSVYMKTSNTVGVSGPQPTHAHLACAPSCATAPYHDRRLERRRPHAETAPPSPAPAIVRPPMHPDATARPTARQAAPDRSTPPQFNHTRNTTTQVARRLAIPHLPMKSHRRQNLWAPRRRRRLPATRSRTTCTPQSF